MRIKNRFETMEKKRVLEFAGKGVKKFFRFRRGFKIYTSITTGILSGIALYDDIYEAYQDKILAVLLAIIAGLFITLSMLIFLKLRWFVIGKLKILIVKLYGRMMENKNK